MPKQGILSPVAKADPRLLVGRAREIQELIDFVKSDTALLVVKGPRRYGKTSLARSFLKLLTETYEGYEIEGEFIPLYVNLDAVTSLGMLGNEVLNGLKTTLDDILELTEWPKHLKQFEKSLHPGEKRFRVSVPIPIVSELSIDYRKRGEVQKIVQLKDVFRYLSRLLREDQKIVLVFDEVQHILDFRERERKIFLEALKDVSDTFYRKMKIIMTGSVIRLVDRILRKRYGDELYGRYITEITLKPLSEDDGIKLLEACLREGNVRYDNTVLTIGTNGTGNVPGWLVRFAIDYVKVLKMNPNVNQHDVARQVITQIAPDMKKSIAADVEVLRSKEGNYPFSQILNYLLKSSSRYLTGSQLEEKFSLSDQDCERVILDLIEYGIIIRNDGKLEIADELTLGRFRNWRYANSLFEKGAYSEAVEFYTDAIEAHPDRAFPDALFNRALAYRMLDLYTNGTADLKTVMELQPNSADAPLLMGDIMSAQYKLEEAKKWYEISLEKDRDNEVAKQRLANIFTRKKNELSEEARRLAEDGNHREAINLLSQAIALEPDDPELQRRLLKEEMYDAGFNEDELRKVLVHCNQTAASSLFTRDPEIYSLRANILTALRQYDDALADRNKAIELDRNEPVYYNNKGVTLFGLRRYAEALVEHGHAAELNPSEQVYRRNVIEDLACLQRFDEAFRDIKAEITSDPKDPMAWITYAFVYAIKGEIENGLRILSEDALIHLEPAAICEALKSMIAIQTLILVESENKLVKEYIGRHC